ncbi:MAG: hypothetical protein ACOCWG_06265 [bacterium]
MKISPDKYYVYVTTDKDILSVVEFSTITILHKMWLEKDWSVHYFAFHIFIN